MKAKIVCDLRAILFLSVMSLKNRLKSILSRPQDILFTLFKFILTISLIVWPLIALRANGMGIASPFPIASITPNLGSIVFLFFTLLIFNAFSKALKNYLPSMFKPADATILFSSPVNRHTIYLYAMLRGLSRNLVSVVMIIAVFFGLTKGLHMTMLVFNIPIVAAGLFAFEIFLQSFRFFLFSVKKKFPKLRSMNIALYAYMVLVVGVMLLSITHTKGNLLVILSMLNSRGLELVPLIGWAKGIFMSLFVPDGNLLIFVLLYIVLAVISFYLSVVWADQYYEEAMTRIDQLEEMRSAHKNRDQVSITRGGKAISTEIRFVGRKTRVFFWKDLLLYKQKLLSKPMKTVLPYLLLLVFGGIVGISLRHVGSKEIVLLLIGFIASNAAGNFGNPVSNEMKYTYLFTMPGRIRDKLFYLSLLSYLKAAVSLFLLFFPSFLFENVSLVGFFALLIASEVMSSVYISGMLIYSAVFKGEENSKNALMMTARGLFNYLYCLPGAALAALFCLITYLTGSHTYFIMGCFGFAAGGMLSIYMIMYLSEKLFRRLEYLN